MIVNELRKRLEDSHIENLNLQLRQHEQLKGAVVQIAKAVRAPHEQRIKRLLQENEALWSIIAPEQKRIVREILEEKGFNNH